AELQLERRRTVVLVVSRRHDDGQIERRDDANRLPPATERADPVKVTLIQPRATEPPQVSVRLIVRRFELRCRRGLDPRPRNDLAVVPATAREDELADLRHVSRSQAQPSSGIAVAPDPLPLGRGDAQRLEQRLAREFVEGTSGRFADDCRYE